MAFYRTNVQVMPTFDFYIYAANIFFHFPSIPNFYFLATFLFQNAVKVFVTRLVKDRTSAVEH
jgi:hypothetical protein